MAQKYNPHEYPCLQYVLGDVRDKERLERVFEGVDYVIHAAALKQVPAAERNPDEYIKTNVVGAMNVISAALKNHVKKVIALSTDKACNPINLYGATKLCSDKLFVAEGHLHESDRTKFAVVRYGNVLGSRGSVVPFFKERAQTGVLPITDLNMTRFWITLDQAAHFVIMSLARAKGGEIFVPRIPSMKITDLGRAIAPECKQEEVGIRPGEKVDETLISEDEARNCVEFEECFIVQNDPNRKEELIKGSLLNGKKGMLCKPNFRFSSDNNKRWLTTEELKEMVQRVSDDFQIEESRWSMDDVPE